MTPLLWNVLEQHLDEAECQFEAIERGFDSPCATLATLARGSERRFDAHVDALAIGGPAAAEELLAPIAARPDPAEPARIAAAAATLAKTARFDLLQGLLRHPDERVRSVAARGGAWCANAVADDWVVRQFESNVSPDAAGGLLHYLAQRGLPPPSAVMRWLRHEDGAVVAAAVRASQGWLDASAWRALDEVLLDHHVGEVRDAALLPLLGAGSRLAWRRCERLALEGVPSPQAAVLLAGLGGPLQHARLARSLHASSSEPARRIALVGLAHSGNVAHLPELLACLHERDAGVQRLAALAIAVIAGLDLRDPTWQSPAARTQAARGPGALCAVEDDAEALAALPALDEDDLDAAPVPSPEASLPAPDAQAIDDWWRRRRQAFRRDVRYLGGHPYSIDAVDAALGAWPLGQRHAVAAALHVRSRGRLGVRTRAPTRQQHSALAGLRTDRGAGRLSGPVQGW